MRIGTGVAGLGDILLLTPICRQTECVVELSRKTERFSFLFDGLARVEIKDSPTNTPDIGDDHFARCKLRALGLDCDDYVPRIVPQVTDDPHGIVWCNTVSSVWKTLRELPAGIEHRILQKLTGLPIFSVGLSSDLKAKTEAYRKSGKYIGCDTGDYHLMLALGGRCIVLVPDDCESYRHARWHYKSDRVKYVNFKDWQSIDENFVSGFLG